MAKLIARLFHWIIILSIRYTIIIYTNHCGAEFFKHWICFMLYCNSSNNFRPHPSFVSAAIFRIDFYLCRNKSERLEETVEICSGFAFDVNVQCSIIFKSLLVINNYNNLSTKCTCHRLKMLNLYNMFLKQLINKIL